MLLFNTHHTTTEEIVKQALQECSSETGEAIIAKKVTRLSKDGMYRVSWRVTVDFKDKDRVLSGESWPEGWGYRKFVGYIRDDKQPAAPFQPKQTPPGTPSTAGAAAVTPAQAEGPPTQLS